MIMQVWRKCLMFEFQTKLFLALCFLSFEYGSAFNSEKSRITRVSPFSARWKTLTDLGPAESLVHNLEYGEILKKTKKSLWRNSHQFYACVYRTQFSFNITKDILQSGFFTAADTKFYCSYLLQWFNAMLNSTSVEKLNMQLCHKDYLYTGEPCVLEIIKDPAIILDCKIAVPFLQSSPNKYYFNARTNSSLMDLVPICVDQKWSSLNAFESLRQYLACRSSSFVIPVSILVASGKEDHVCHSNSSMEGMQQRPEEFLQKAEAAVELSLSVVEGCLRNLTCRDRTCYKSIHRCNFKSECLTGDDESGCQCGYFCDFEDKTGCTCPWVSHSDKSFSVYKAVEAQKYWQYNFPRKDATKGTSEGSYILNRGPRNKRADYIVSGCFGSSGPQCSLHFHTIVFGIGMEYLDAYIDKGCSSSNENWSHIGRVGPTGSTNRWHAANFSIGRRNEEFSVIMKADLPNEKSYVAIDGLELRNCDPNKTEDGSCQRGYFQCFDSKCISPDKICNVDQDCTCGEDENPHTCNRYPFYSKTLFKGCDFNGGKCWLYNANTGDDMNWTLVNDTDHGKYILFNTTNQSTGHTAILRSTELPAPKSPNCKVRFFYNMHEDNVYKLKLEVIEVNSTKSKITLWQCNEQVLQIWPFEVVSLDDIHSAFILQFVAYVGYTLPGGDISITDVTFSRECFQESLDFAPCEAHGSSGPTQAMCDAFYRQSKLKVEVVKEGIYQGAQVFEIPKTGIYSLTVLGARGGRGAWCETKPPGGEYVHAMFNFTEGTRIYMAIGQKGEDACSAEKMKNADTQNLCRTKNTETVVSGGGGGGGGTYLFLVNEDTQDPELLVVAGGGGGLGSMSNWNDVRKVKRQKGNAGDGYNGYSYDAGGGSGWLSLINVTLKGVFLVQGMEGGRSCKESKFHTSGGFGGGGGACSAGGGGGGYSGGDVCVEDNARCVGESGTSYAHPSGKDVVYQSAIQDEDGEVNILYQTTPCPCEEFCHWTDKESLKYTCSCGSNSVLASDGHTCVVYSSTEKPVESGSVDMGLIAAVTTPAVVFILIIVACVCFYGRRGLAKKCHPGLAGLDVIMSYCQSKSFRGNQGTRQNVQRPTAIMEFNVNYDFIGAKHPEQHLPEIPRRNVRLVRPLGQGAFGEVYQGLLSHVPHVQGDLSIAVKTLPALCTEQTDLDFFMEAVIVSKFSHPNIVKFLGVCFDQRPRFIVLELLDGGDLKSFLRESRPKPSEPSNLTVLDLLRLALDIARGCQHLEEKHFIHRDIAARNCLLTTKGPTRTAKIADFGMARDIYRSDYYKKAGNALLPVKWMPPEAFLDGVFTTKTDVWSFGIVLWEIFSLGYMPYPGCSNEEVMHFVTIGGRLNAPDSCPSSVYDIMASCWSGLSEERPPFSLIITSLEKCMQDEDVIYNSLPILYLPPMSAIRGFKIPMSLKPSGSHNQSGGGGQNDGYMEPLLPSWNMDSQQDGIQRTGEDSGDDIDNGHKRSRCDGNYGNNSPKSSTPKVQPPQMSPSEIPLLSVEDFQALFESEPPEGCGIKTNVL